METQRVLIVDDERNIRLTLKGALEAIGLEVDAVFQGEEALQKLTEKTYTVMILDLRLPGMDGLAVLRQVAERYAGLRVIIITAYGTVEAVIDAMKLGRWTFCKNLSNPRRCGRSSAGCWRFPKGAPLPLPMKIIWSWPEKVSGKKNSAPLLSMPIRPSM